MRTCARCDKPIMPGEPYDTADVVRPTGAGAVVVLHKVLCKRPNRQTTQALIRY